MRGCIAVADIMVVWLGEKSYACPAFVGGLCERDRIGLPSRQTTAYDHRGVYRDVAGCLLPRNSAKQAEFCERIEEKDARIGDLVFFATGKDPEKISHVGIIVDPDNFIHASTTKGVVVSKFHTPYYTARLKMYGRVPKHKSGRD